MVLQGGNVLESAYQAQLIRKLRRRFPGCFVLKNDASYLQGVPDLLVLYGNRWAMLEVKASADATEQPNQAYYISLLAGMSYAAFIHPQNEQDVLRDLEFAFATGRNPRLSKSQQLPLDELRRGEAGR
jgi:hypothetical protein